MTEENEVVPVELPEPTGYRILIMPAAAENKSTGGILLDSSTTDANKHLSYVGTVVDMGHLCYTHDKFRVSEDRDPEPWCRIGDSVLYGQYAGQKIKVTATDGSDIELILLNDDEIKGRVADPGNYRAYI